MTYDAVVMGAGVAGCTAAIALQANQQRVALVDRQPPAGGEGPRPDWLTAGALPMLEALHVKPGDWLGPPFKGATFHPSDLSKSAESIAGEPAGYRVDYAGMVSALRARAAEGRVTCVFGTAPSSVESGEDAVVVSVEGHDAIEARFLVLAAGAEGGAAGPPGAPAVWVAEIVAPMKGKTTDDLMHWCIGLEGGQALAAWWFEGGRVVIQLQADGVDEPPLDLLRAFVRRLNERRLLPKTLEVDENHMRVRPAASRFALELDSHVGKRSLLVGDAGGFYCRASREGIYPAIWSARLAADVIARAGKSRHPQDELRKYSSEWRMKMAEYLRPPNTDMQFLLPLVFTNQQMADRLAAAFWHGENI